VEQGQRQYKPIPGSPAPASPATVQPQDAEPTAEELDVILPPDLRYRNPGIECAYISAEQVLVSGGYEEFRGWGPSLPKTDYGREMGYILAALNERGIEYVAVRNGDTSIFEHARRERLPVYVQVPGHAYVVLRLTSRYAYIVNNFTASGPQAIDQAEKSSKNVYKIDRNYFLRHRWTGSAFCLKCRRKKKDQPAVVVSPQAVPAVQPGPLNPTPPVVHPAPPPAEKPALKECQCKPVELGPVNEALVKLTEIAAATSKSVADLGGKVGTLDARIAVVEGKLADAATLPPPSATVSPEQLKAVQDELARLRNRLKQSGTLKVTVLPK
jgi:hypothetical protein